MSTDWKKKVADVRAELTTRREVLVAELADVDAALAALGGGAARSRIYSGRQSGGADAVRAAVAALGKASAHGIRRWLRDNGHEQFLVYLSGTIGALHGRGELTASGRSHKYVYALADTSEAME